MNESDMTSKSLDELRTQAQSSLTKVRQNLTNLKQFSKNVSEGLSESTSELETVRNLSKQLKEKLEKTQTDLAAAMDDVARLQKRCAIFGFTTVICLFIIIGYIVLKVAA